MGQAQRASTALRAISMFEESDIYFVETPLPSDDVEGYAKLAAASSQRIAAGEISAAEAVAAAVARAEAWQPRICAVVHDTYEAAMQQAATPPSGRFAGVPTFVKDLEDVFAGRGETSATANVALRRAVARIIG